MTVERQKRREFDWVEIERVYRESHLTQPEICQRFGMTERALRHHIQNGEWLRNGSGARARLLIIKRIYALIEQKVIKMEVSFDPEASKEIAALENLLKAVERLAKLEGKARADTTPTAAYERDMAEIRVKLAKRIEQLAKA